MKKTWLAFMLVVGLCAAAGAGSFSAASAATTRPEKAAPTPGTSRLRDINPSTWMGDEAANLWYNQLSHILIPGTHDSTTYSIDGFYSETQDQELTQQLNDGIREFDIRVGWAWNAARGWAYYAEHGITYSTWLNLPRIFSDIDGWAIKPGHDKEIILLNLTIAENGSNFFPGQDCQVFANTLGGSLVTPHELQAHFGTTDPGQVTLGQLWSLPDPTHAARVIMNSTQCMDATDPNAGSWTDGDGNSLFSGYYANWCNDDFFSPPPWVASLDLGAANGRFIQGGGSPNNYGPSKVGGLYTIDVQSTPDTGQGQGYQCLRWPAELADSQQSVLTQLLGAYAVTGGEGYPGIRNNLNIIEGDYYEKFNLVGDIIGTDGGFRPTATPPTADPNTAVTAGDGQASVAFADADYGNLPLTYVVTATDTTNPSTPPVTATGTSSPITVKGLTNGDVWTFQIIATSSGADDSPPVDAGGVRVGVPAAIVSGPAATGTVGTPYSSGFTVTGAPPPTVTLVSGTLPPGLTPLHSDGTLAGTPTQAGSYTFTVQAYNHVKGPARDTVTITIVGSAPAAPAITGLTNGDGQVTVAFSGAAAGSAPITSYTVRATDQDHPAAPPVTATGPSSPITVKGLTNGDPYVFTVTATSADGTSPPSAPSGALNVGVAPVIASGPAATGTVGTPYSSGFTVTGAPPPTVTLVSGTLPPGLTPLHSNGTLTGTPTQAGSYTFTVQAANPVGLVDSTVTVKISAG